MGCAISRPDDDSPLLALCRRRRSLIRSALRARFALAAAHSAYFRSLRSLSAALHRFLAEDTVLLPSPPPSPVLTIPSDRKSTSSSLLQDDLSYMRSSAPAPDVIFEDPSAYTPYPGYGAYFPSPHAVPDAYAYYDEMRRREAAGTPPPPPPAGGSAWDIFNPFFNDEQSMYRPGTPDSSEVREREGIPDLEEDTEHEPVRDARRGKQPVVEEHVGTSREVGSSSHEIESSDSSGEGSCGEIESSEFEERELGGGSSKSGMSNVGEGSGRGTLDVMEAMGEVERRFKAAAGLGEEVAGILEVGMVPYRSGRGAFTEMRSRILNIIARASSTLPHVSFKRRRLSGASHIEKHIDENSGSLSTTLEKLYMWEKKLYKEVKDEEALRIIYNKKWRRLKDLDFRGEQPEKIHATRESIRNLSTRISVVMRSIDSISSMVHKIRDEELKPQLIELIQGLMKMWRLVLDCHQNQFQALIHSKSDRLVVKTSSQRTSVSRATRDLEIELLRWRSCFADWIRTQRVYIESLNGWLIKWLVQEQELTPDGAAPFSPSRVGAPAAFTIANDWYHATEKLSEVEVSKAMDSCAGSLHELWESQKKERYHKMKVEYLARDFARSLKSMQKDNGMNDNMRSVLTTGDAAGHNNAAVTTLDLLRKKLDEERAKHEEIRQHMQLASSSFLETGLLPIFEALRKFTLETVKAYGEVRIQNEGQGT